MSTNPEARAWIEVRADALVANYARIREEVGGDVGILPMVKADAYGLGLERVVTVLEREDPWGFGVATVTEGLALREAGIGRRVVVCGPTPPAALAAAVDADLEISVSSLEALDAVGAAARAAARTAAVHVDVDTGMGRSGFDWATHAEWLPAAQHRFGGAVRWAGVYSHLHSADEGAGSVHEQADRLERVLGAIEKPPAGLVVHLLNSPGVFRARERARGVVRPGIFLYGGGIGEGQPSPAPVVSIRARVVHLRDASAGTTLGYGATHVASGDERWATLAVGYGDGLPRALSNRGSALISGRRVSIVGRISMDVTVVDISDIPRVAVGDVATLLGSDGDEAITLDDVASEAGTISYEILTGLTPRLPRVWTDLDG